MNNPNDTENYNYQEEEYAQDAYSQGYEGEAAAEGYNESHLPTTEERSFFQKYGFTAILIGAGLFAAWMGYNTFAPMFAAPKSQNAGAPAANADALLNPSAPAETGETQPPQSGEAAPVIPAPATTEAAPPAIAAMGVSPAAPVTSTNGVASAPVSPPSDPNDPWAQAATSAVAPAPATPAEPVPPVTTPAPVPAPAPTQQAGAAPTPVTVPATPPSAAAADAMSEHLAELEKKLASMEAKAQQQDTVIADLQNQLAEAQLKASTPKTESDNHEPAPKPKPKAERQPAKPKPVETVKKPASAWELRSASDGVAWVSRPADNQLFRIAVGDQVPGLGRITAIRQQGEAWVVVGTEGQIRE